MGDTSGLNCEEIRHSGDTHPIVLNDPAEGDVVLLNPPLSPLHSIRASIPGYYDWITQRMIGTGDILFLPWNHNLGEHLFGKTRQGKSGIFGPR